MYIIDAHEDIAWNILSFGRDYTRSAAETRRLELDTLSQAPMYNGHTLLGWPDYQHGDIVVVFSTLFAAPLRRSLGAWDSQAYQTDAEAEQRYSSQLDAYHRLVDSYPDHFRIVETRSDLDEILTQWESAEEDNKNDPDQDTDVPSTSLPSRQVGLLILMEGAEGVRQPASLETWWARGVRVIGPAWAGTRFCGGTGEPGPLTAEGYELLEKMASFGFALDLSHMDEKAALQSLDFFPGPLAASHANALALLDGTSSNRFLSDQVISRIIERDGVIGVVPYNKFLQVGWKKSDGKDAVTLNAVVNQIDYICQLAGDARHVGIGSDFDGGFGWDSVPGEIDTVADLGKIAPLLMNKGYTNEDIAAVLGVNWKRFLDAALPEVV